jgi:hypothetical protein
MGHSVPFLPCNSLAFLGGSTDLQSVGKADEGLILACLAIVVGGSQGNQSSEFRTQRIEPGTITDDGRIAIFLDK